MQQRRAAARRPLGTDGSDFSYRMVVDSRYAKVAKGKSRLKALIAAQVIIQVIGSLWILLSALEEKELDRFAVLSNSIGIISLLFAELGQTCSQGLMLRLYTITSSLAIAFSITRVVRSDSFVKVSRLSSLNCLDALATILKAVQYKNVSAMTNYELVEVACVLLGVLLQIPVIITTITLVDNMSPKRSS